MLLCLMVFGLGCAAFYLLWRARGIDMYEESLDAKEFRGLVIYDMDGFSAHEVSAETLGKIEHVRIAAETANEIFRDVAYRTRERVWKGSLLATVRLADGSERHLAISHYGGFFKVVGQSGCYETLGGSRVELEKVIHRVLAGVFIPLRRNRLNTTLPHDASAIM